MYCILYAEINNVILHSVFIPHGEGRCSGADGEVTGRG